MAARSTGLDRAVFRRVWGECVGGKNTESGVFCAAQLAGLHHCLQALGSARGAGGGAAGAD